MAFLQFARSKPSEGFRLLRIEVLYIIDLHFWSLLLDYLEVQRQDILSCLFIRIVESNLLLLLQSRSFLPTFSRRDKEILGLVTGLSSDLVEKGWTSSLSVIAVLTALVALKQIKAVPDVS